jgi:hypothetical protein
MTVNAATFAVQATPAVSNAKRAVMPLITTVVATVVLTAGASALVIACTGRAGWWSGWLAALAVSLFATFASLIPLALGLQFGAQNAAYGYLGGVTARLLTTIFGVLAAVYIFRAPVVTTLVLLMPLYLAALVAECTALWRIFATGK